MSATRERVTMKTIAEEAGVTLTTVSRILNNKGGKYAEGTKAKIFEIADRVKYRPNALVHGMQTGRTSTAGVMVPVSTPFYAQVVTGIHHTFLENGTIMLLGWNPLIGDHREEATERRIIHQLVDRRVDGVILRPSCEEFERPYFEEIWERDVPLILIDREMSNVTTDFVGTDDEAGGRMATEYLISQGHRQLLFVGSSERVSTSRHREDGFRKVLSETVNACGRSLDTSQPDLDDAIRRLFEQDAPPTAVFCYNDTTAETTAKVLTRAGLCIPEDISLMGFGNEPSGNCPVALTTFDQHPQLIGKTAAEMYLERLEHGTDNGIRRERIPPDIIIRASTCPRAAS
jgi:LacI family transcriptional regulator